MRYFIIDNDDSGEMLGEFINGNIILRFVSGLILVPKPKCIPLIKALKQLK
jgi:hypothetical protein